MSLKPPALPDLEDEEDADFRRKLSPLIARVLPTGRRTRADKTDAQGDRELQEKEPAGLPDIRTSVLPEGRLIRQTNSRNNGQPPKRRPTSKPQDRQEQEGTGLPAARNSGVPDLGTTGRLTEDPSGVMESRFDGGRLDAAAAQARVEAARGTKRRFEYLIPERVGRALAHEAAAQGKSATSLLLEVLRTAGYPVIDEDLVDLRKMPKR